MRVPSFNDVSGICKFHADLMKYEGPPLTLNFCNLGFAKPMGMVLLARIISHAQLAGKVAGIVGHEPHTYPANMGFFAACGFDVAAADAPGNQNYFPVRKINTSEVRADAEKFKEHPGETVQRLSSDLAALLTREYESEVYKLIKYSLREIIRNTIEHSEAESILVSGQYWPATGEVQLAMSDEGIGLSRGLAGNPHLKIGSDHDAIRYALLPGVSGKTYEGADIGKKTAWTNSGFGLFMTSQICRQSGTFFIGSGEEGMFLGADEKSNLEFGLSGTTIVLNINVTKLSRTEPLLAVLARKGERIAKLIGNGDSVEASVASKLIMD